MKLLLATLLVCLAVPSSAIAHITVDPPDAQFQSWLDRSFMPTPDLTVAVSDDYSGCGDPNWTFGCSLVEPATIWSVRSRDVFLHEVGHLYDGLILDDADRAWFMRLYNGRRWTDAIGEKFADTYSLCARRKKLRPGRSYFIFGGLPKGSKVMRGCRRIVNTFPTPS